MRIEQKEKNLCYVLDHLDEYAIDVHGNLVNVAPDTDGEEWFFCFGKDSFTEEGYKEINKKIGEMILQKPEEWELVYLLGYFSKEKLQMLYFKHRESKKEVYFKNFDFETMYRVVGALGHRESIWKDYEENMKRQEEIDRQRCRRSTSNNSQSSPQSQDSRQNNSPKETELRNQEKSQKEPSLSQSNSKCIVSSDKKDSKKVSSTEAQNVHNSEKDKTTIDDNSHSTNPKDQHQIQEFQKMIIKAEIMIKNKKNNPEILSILSKEKKNNTSNYQLFNQKGRIDKLINQLESIQKSQENSNSSTNKNNKTPTGLIWGGGLLFLVVVIGSTILLRKSKRKQKNKTTILPKS